ncbi:MAG: U32 family peptidase [Prevotella sp.]|jgi:putative protease|nr:U32 family peptidase [Prevotella sp.]
MNLNDFEIMAPVGSRESLAAALKAGAGSVYFGVEQLNMRSHSANHFTIDDLREIAATCEQHGVKSYLTVNTIIYGEDIALMHQIIDAAVEAHISAVIACDIAVMTYCRQRGMEVHLSTQLNISNIEALKFYAQFADVVVLARELNLDQVADIYRQIEEQHICGPSGQQIRIEMFCHGALCMAVSGKCYMSLDNTGRSANRGECMQICRRSYIVTDRETGTELEIDNKYIMSPKDLKTIRFIDRMMKSGVRVFKIEGRARGPEYVLTVVQCYKAAIQSVLDGTFSEAQKDEWDRQLATVFNRGFWDGYYQGQPLGEWNKHYGSCATERKQYVGKGVKYFSKLGVAEFTCEACEFSVGDKMLITGPTTGALYVTVDEIHDDVQSVQTAQKGTRVSIKVPEKVRPSDKLFKIITL